MRENEHFSFPKKMEYDAQVKADDAARETLGAGSHSHEGSIEEEVEDVGLTVDHEDGIPEEVASWERGTSADECMRVNLRNHVLVKC